MLTTSGTSVAAFSRRYAFDLIGKHGRVRTAPMPNWVKVAIDAWSVRESRESAKPRAHFCSEFMPGKIAKS